MASRAVAKSAVDWTAFGKKLGPAGRDKFRTIKGTYDQNLARMTKLPENMPKIDFAYYKSRMASPAMAQEFEKAYESIKVPYPTDSEGILKSLDAEGAKQADNVTKIKADLDNQVQVFRDFVAAVDTLPPWDEFTKEMYYLYFPKHAFNFDKPTLYPHTPSFQPESPNFPYNYGGKKW